VNYTNIVYDYMREFTSFDYILSVMDFMPNINVLEISATISATEIVPPTLLQLGATFSYGELPSMSALFIAATFSVGPGKPIRYAPINVKSKGPVSFFTDMPVSGKGK